ncbi:MAG: hypothetical protein HUK01_02230 [Bacteroidaceae bacterium]|nr:hypothetical protein [Bacteroidaceae bacterium]
MKQHTTHNDEALYRQFLAELKPGADEYDRLVGATAATTTDSTLPPRRPLRLWRWAAAACILLVLGVLTARLTNQNGTEQKPKRLATQSLPAPHEITQIFPSHEDGVDSQEQCEVNTEASRADRRAANRAVVEEKDAAEPPAPTAEDAAMVQALLSEVCYRALAEQEKRERIHRALCEEITANIANQSNTTIASL